MATKESGNFQLHLEEVSKRFGREWIIRQFSDSFASGGIYGIRGRNGSGKSTLLRLLAGQLSPSRGRITWTLDGKPVPVAEVYRLVSWTGPYLEIVEELTVAEFLTFHYTLKRTRDGLTVDDLLDRIELTPFRHRKITNCSSGMRQRVLLATALYADTPLLLLDEPTVTLDQEAAEWFARELATCSAGRLTVIASNDPRDLTACVRVRNL